MTYFFVQTRKRNVDLILCTHHIDHIDKRAQAERKLAESAEHQDTAPHIGCTCALCATINKLEEAETDRQSGMEEVGSVQTKIDMLRSSLQDLVSAMHIYQQEVDYDFPPPHQRDAIRRAERTLKSTE